MVLNAVGGVLLAGLMVVSVPNASALRVAGGVKLVFWLRMDTYLGACGPGRGISGGLWLFSGVEPCGGGSISIFQEFVC